MTLPWVTPPGHCPSPPIIEGPCAPRAPAALSSSPGFPDGGCFCHHPSASRRDCRGCLLLHLLVPSDVAHRPSAVCGPDTWSRSAQALVFARRALLGVIGTWRVTCSSSLCQGMCSEGRAWAACRLCPWPVREGWSQQVLVPVSQADESMAVGADGRGTLRGSSRCGLCGGHR